MTANSDPVVSAMGGSKYIGASSIAMQYARLRQIVGIVTGRLLEWSADAIAAQ